VNEAPRADPLLLIAFDLFGDADKFPVATGRSIRVLPDAPGGRHQKVEEVVTVEQALPFGQVSCQVVDEDGRARRSWSGLARDDASDVGAWERGGLGRGPG
jgi:hypothetical protein